jgi:cell division protein FtsQ
MFQISELRIQGNGIVSDETLRQQTGLIVHQTSMFAISEKGLEERLLKVPWIAKARVTKKWPSAIVIAVTENIPLALLHSSTPEGGELSYIDSRGVSFLPLEAGGSLDYPVITGLDSITDQVLRQRSLHEVLVFLKKVRRNDPHLPVQSLSEVHVTTSGEMVIYLVDYPFPIFFGNGNTKQKYARLLQVLKALYKKEKNDQLITRVAYIQMDYQQDKVLVAQNGSDQ